MPLPSLTSPPHFATAAMGTRFELVIEEAAVPREEWSAIAEAALDTIESCHRRLTRFASDSLVSHIARTAHLAPVRLDADTFALFEDALAVWRASGGAFDITVASAMDGTGDAFKSAMAAIVLDPVDRTIRCARPLTLDLGGIGKGHALDLAARELRGHGVTAALLHGGTSSAIAIGTPPGDDGWRVALGTFDDAPVVSLRDDALSVSAMMAPDGVAHVVDPAGGGRTHEERTAAVVGPSARLADAWSTALLLLGRRPAALTDEWRIWLL